MHAIFAAFAASDRVQVVGMGGNAVNQGRLSHVAQKAPTAEGGGGTALAALPLRDTLVRIGRDRPTYVKLDIEAGECAAVRGMGDWLRTARIVGLQIEMQPATKACCERERWNLPGGFFHTLNTTHGLVANSAACLDGPTDVVWSTPLAKLGARVAQ